MGFFSRCSCTYDFSKWHHDFPDFATETYLMILERDGDKVCPVLGNQIVRCILRAHQSRLESDINRLVLKINELTDDQEDVKVKKVVTKEFCCPRCKTTLIVKV